MKNRRHDLMMIALYLPLAYLGIAFVAFQYNNPLANRMSFYRDFWSVVCWETLPKYQLR